MPSFINEVQLPLASSGVWETVNLSSYIPADAEVVFLRVRNSAGDTIRYDARCKGSTDNHLYGGDPGQKDIGLHWQACKVNDNKEIEIFRGASITVFLFGYLKKSECYGFVNMPEINLTPQNAWQPLEINPIKPPEVGRAYAAVIQPIYKTNNSGTYGLRPTGGTSTVNGGAYGTVCGLMTVELDSNGRCEAYKGTDSTISYFVVALIKKDIVRSFKTPVNVSPTAGSYQDTVTLDKKGYAAMFDVTGTYGPTYDIRPKDAPTMLATPGRPALHVMVGAVPSGTDRKIQTYRSSTAVEIWHVGYWKVEEAGGLFFGTHF